MAFLNKPKKKDTRKTQDKTETVQKTHKIVYDTPYWKQLRKTMLMEHPICQMCGNALATEVHHIRELSKATSDLEMYSLGFDINNLMCLCSECHHKIHSGNVKKS